MVQGKRKCNLNSITSVGTNFNNQFYFASLTVSELTSFIHASKYQRKSTRMCTPPAWDICMGFHLRFNTSVSFHLLGTKFIVNFVTSFVKCCFKLTKSTGRGTWPKEKCLWIGEASVPSAYNVLSERPICKWSYCLPHDWLQFLNQDSKPEMIIQPSRGRTATPGGAQGGAKGCQWIIGLPQGFWSPAPLDATFPFNLQRA